MFDEEVGVGTVVVAEGMEATLEGSCLMLAVGITLTAGSMVTLGATNILEVVSFMQISCPCTAQLDCIVRMREVIGF